ncbi:MAG: hypothetical protein U0529_16795 [Thermoanaerobaculia bacterium]
MSRKATSAVVAPSPRLEEADAAWAGRAEGSQGGRARPGPVRRVIALLRAELAAEPRSVEARWRLMRALYFAGEYASSSEAEAKASFLEATTVAEECLALLRARAAEGSSRDFSRATPLELVPRFAGDPEAVSAFEWGAVAWGMYALAKGILAAAREGAVARIRDYAEAVNRLAPALDDAAGDRTLGRLHHKTPSIPLLTGWVSGKEAIRHLRRAVAIAPTSLVNRLFLAEALHEFEPSRLDEVISIAEGVVDDTPDPKWLVEHEHARVVAKALLKSWRAARR